MTLRGRELRSRISQDGRLTLSIEMVEVPLPGDDEVVVKVEAAPINPSDMGLLLGPADLPSLVEIGTADAPALSFTIPPARLAGFRGRLNQSLPVGNEGAGTVIAAGRNVRTLQGRRVGMIGTGTYADYCTAPSRNVIVLPPYASAADGAAMFVNPLTALGFVETARRDGHKAIVHTAAASNLGQMLQKICLADKIPLINIVRTETQADILRSIGAIHILVSGEADFRAKLTDLIEATGATIAFDAIGGGALGSDILQAMERAAIRQAARYDRYGSDMFKQLYLYGALDPAPTMLQRLGFGWQWSVSGWLLFPFLRSIGVSGEDRLRKRIGDELTTTFASRYKTVIGLGETLQPSILRAFSSKSTGEKYLIDPTRG